MQIGGRWYLGRRGMMLLLLGGLWIWLGLNVPMTPSGNWNNSFARVLVQIGV